MVWVANCVPKEDISARSRHQEKLKANARDAHKVNNRIDGTLPSIDVH